MYGTTGQNPAQIPARTWLDPRLELKASPLGGCGLFTAAPIGAGETVLVWGGASYTDAAGAQAAARAGKSVMQWDEQVYSVATNDDDSAFKINHSCDPNVWMKGAFTLVARRAIAAGEEVVADYALWETSEAYVASWECHCGSALCRRRITGRDWRLLDLQERYHDHFSPVLERRIARMLAPAQKTRPSTRRRKGKGEGKSGGHN
jgi:uncharacterized protein